jgi:hypothetical protein
MSENITEKAVINEEDIVINEIVVNEEEETVQSTDNTLVIDIDITGDIKDKDKWIPTSIKPNDLISYPYIVTIAWILYENTTHEIIEEKYIIIKPKHYIIRKKSSNIHGITTHLGKKHGIGIVRVMNDLVKRVIPLSNTIISNDLDYVFNIINTQLYRNNIPRKNKYYDIKIPTRTSMNLNKEILDKDISDKKINFNNSDKRVRYYYDKLLL